MQLPTLTTGQLAAAASAIDGGVVYDTTTNGVKACINGAYVSLGAGGAANAFATIACGAGTNPVADASTDTLTLTGTEITVTGDSATDTVTFSIPALAVTAAKLANALDVSGKTITLPTSQTITTPTIADFTNATHTHADAATGGTLSTPALAGTTAAVFTIDSDNVAAAKVAIDTNSATGAFTATIVPPNLSANATVTLPAATSSLATLALTETLASKTLTAPVINGLTSSGATALNFGGSSAAFTTSTGTNTLSGNVAIPADKTFTQTGIGTFSTGTGAVSLNGDVTIAAAKSLALSGAGTIATGTGAISLNGAVTIATTKGLTMGSGTGIGGSVDIYRDGAAGKSIALVPGTSLTIADNTAISGAYTFGTGTGAVSLNGDTTVATAKALNMGTATQIAGNLNIYRDNAAAKSIALIPGTSLTIADNTAISGAYTFGTGTGAVSLNGDVTIADAKTFAMTGAGTFGTGTGAVSINGDLTIASGKAFAMTGAGTFGTGTGAVTLNGNTTVPTGKNFAVVDGAVGLGSGAITTTYATMVTNLNADKVDGKHSADFSAPAYACFNTSGALGVATVYVGPGIEAATATDNSYFVAPTAGTLTKMYCNLGTAPGGADTVAYTVRIDGVDKTITATISAAETTANDTAHTEAVAAGEKVSIKAVSSAATAADSSVTLEFITKTN